MSHLLPVAAEKRSHGSFNNSIANALAITQTIILFLASYNEISPSPDAKLFSAQNLRNENFNS